MKRVLAGLRQMYGPKKWQHWGKGVDILVETILSQNTSNANSSAGFKRLRRHFRSWNQVMNAPVEEVEKCIRVSGLSRVKAPRIQSILRQIKNDRGKLDLEFLADLPPEEGYEFLKKFSGVGPKTANCVLLFSFGMGVFPVDTHIHRIAIRLGLIPEKSSAAEAHELLKEMIEPADRYEMHILLVEHGRKTCKARNPLCHKCALLAMCPLGRVACAASALSIYPAAQAGSAEAPHLWPRSARRFACF